MKEFDLEKAKAGAPVCTRDGKPVRIICWDAKDPNYPIVALVDNFDTETAETYTDDGFWQKDKTDNELDLMMATVKHEGWVIIGTEVKYCYACVYDTQEEAEAKASSSPSHVVVAHIEWEE